MIGDDVFQRVKPARLARILDKYRQQDESEQGGENG
jgi:NADH:ubiquinone oxidoreductase subunit E